MGKDQVVIIILNWRRAQDTLECLESVFRLTYPSFRVVVCDNGSGDGSLERIKSWALGSGEKDEREIVVSHPPAAQGSRPIECLEFAGQPNPDADDGRTRLVLIQTGANLGYAGGNNIGIRYALKSGARFVWILNNDTIVHPESLSELVRAFKSARETPLGILGSCIRYHDRPMMTWALGGTIHPFLGVVRLSARLEGRPIHVASDVYVTEHVFGCAFLARTDLIRDVGPIDESYFLYGEETDWMVQARKRGWKIGVSRSSLVFHKVGSDDAGIRRDYYSTRNVLYFFWKNFPLQFLIAFPLIVLRRVIAKTVLRLLCGKMSSARWILQGFYDFLSGRRGFRPGLS